MSGNQLHMPKRSRRIRSLAFLIPVPLFAACDARVLSFEPADAGSSASDGAFLVTGQNQPDSSAPGSEGNPTYGAAPPCDASMPPVDLGDAAPPHDLAPCLALNTLDDTQAGVLCTWLNTMFPMPLTPGTQAGPTSGFATGPSVGGCGANLDWVSLDDSLCAQNLRHAAACEATVGDLEPCIASLVTNYDNGNLPNPGPTPDCASACAALVVPSCNGTVVGFSPVYGEPCTMSQLPVAPGASCNDDAGP